MGQRGNVRRGGERPVWERADGCTAATAEGGWYSAACLPLLLTHQRAQGPAPSQLCSHDRKTTTTTTSEPEKITVRFGPGFPALLPLSFSVLAVVLVQKCPIMWVKMHGCVDLRATTCRFHQAESWSPAGVVVGSGPRFILPGRWWNCCSWPAHIHSHEGSVAKSWLEPGPTACIFIPEGWLHTCSTAAITTHFNLGSVSQPSQKAFYTPISSFVPSSNLPQAETLLIKTSFTISKMTKQNRKVDKGT